MWKEGKEYILVPRSGYEIRNEGTKLNTNIETEMDTHNIIIEFTVTNGKDLEHKSKNSLLSKVLTAGSVGLFVIGLVKKLVPWGLALLVPYKQNKKERNYFEAHFGFQLSRVGKGVPDVDVAFRFGAKLTILGATNGVARVKI